MKKNFYYYCCLPTLILLFTQCRPSLELQAVEIVPTVKVETFQEISAGGTYRLSGKKYRLPYAVNEIQYVPQWQQMAIQYDTPKRWGAYGIYDLRKEQFNWSNRGDYSLSMLQKDVALVRSPDKKILINAENSLPIRWLKKEEFVVVDDSVAINLSDRFARVDLKTGKELWSRPGEARYEGWMSDELDGDWMYVIGNGLHGFNITTGEGWHHQATTNYDATRGGKAIANGILIGLNILSIAYGGGYVDDFLYFDPLRAHNIHAKPKIEGNELYFADRKTIVCLAKETGEDLWVTNVKEELGVSALTILNENDLLLFGKGYRYVDYALDKDRQATICLLDKQSGEIISQEFLPKGDIIVNHAVNDAFIYTLTANKIYQFDNNLSLIKKVKLPSIYGPPLRVVTWSSVGYDEFLETDRPDFPLVIRTLQGVVALHPVTLEELWYKRLGNIAVERPSVINADKWQLPILLQDAELRRSWMDESTEIFWFAKVGKIIGLDLLNEGEVVAEFEFPSDNFWYVRNGELIQYGGRDIRIMDLRSD